MMDDLLIELVKAHSVLYNLADPKYMDSGLKMRVWNDIGQKMDAKGERCKARWNNIRDNYKKSLKKIKIKSVQAEKKVKRYRFANQLSFLDTYFDERDTKGNISLSADDDCESEDDEEHDSSNTAEPQPKQQIMPQDVNNTDTPTENISDKTDSSAFSTPQRCCTKRKIHHEPPGSSILMKYIIENNSTQGSTTSNQATVHLQHPVDAFLFGISPMLKSLPPYYLSLAKSDIFATVHKYEMMMLTKHSNTSTKVSCQRAFQPLEAFPENASTDSPFSSSCCSNNNNEY